MAEHCLDVTGVPGSSPGASTINFLNPSLRTMIFIVSIFVSIFSLALVILGLPAQIIKNYKEKRSGQPLLTIIIAVGFYISSIIFLT